MKKTGVAALGLAILISGVGKFAPHWFLSLPFPMSVILWSWTGHKMPPCEYVLNSNTSYYLAALAKR